MDNSELLQSVLQDVYMSVEYVGCYPNDRIPRTVYFPAGLIVNKDNHIGPGYHWVAMHIDSFGQGVYFDSLGREPSLQAHQFLTRNCVSYIRNYNAIQHPASSMCGLFCVLFLYFMARGYNLSQFLGLFSNTNLEMNDHIVTRLARNLRLIQ